MVRIYKSSQNTDNIITSNYILEKFGTGPMNTDEMGVILLNHVFEQIS